MIKKYILKKSRKPLNISLLEQNREEVSLVKYIEAYQAKSQMDLIRKNMVKYALKHGNEKAAETYECHRNTVSKFINRFKKEGKEGLKNRSRAPHNIPHKLIDPKAINFIVEKRDEDGYGSFRLKMQHDMPWSNMAINRVLNDFDKIDEQKKKHQTKQDLWNIKQTYKSLETKLQLDAKNLLDIPNYYHYYKLLGLPKWQFTLRDVKSGTTYTSFCKSENGLAACTFVTYVFEHFKRHGIDVTKILIQTDGASYALNLHGLNKTEFKKLIENIYKAKLKSIPQGGTCQSDVETFHSLVEREFYNREGFTSVEDFYIKAYKFVYKFNYIRKNSHKDWKTPVYFLNQDRPNTPVEVLDLPPIDLDKHPDIYWCKKNPKHIPTWESRLLDLTPEELPCKDFSHNEYLDNFVKRVIGGYNEAGVSAHDLPIYPSFTKSEKGP